jgi:hypothetical protein
MALPLSPNTAKAIDRLFPPESKEEAVRLLTEECADNLPNCQSADQFSIEDLRFQALKLSNGNIEELRGAVRLAQEDWRDLLQAGSIWKFRRELLGAALECNKHSHRMMIVSNVGVMTIIVDLLTSFVLRMMHVSLLVFGCVLLAIAGVSMACLMALTWRDFPDGENSRIKFAWKMMFYVAFAYVGMPAAVGAIAATIVRAFV